ncbi:ROK family transcriptional regulator [Pedobacter caeni]|uniref:Sugar kinase of the NBD/HSP70 family, may contain an N-terminal HTH domain n=1 Tax=Pedobacter caeni TaxID=288992 RepID=A0A1M5JQ97_9SPHI|nr:ROK family protein [Pedobacter caeni]SHG42724.1 Sugar kinase of the NBD/HSP70 family, may contain an N-terminal HTH domain [Pedobacter caeni]
MNLSLLKNIILSEHKNDKHLNHKYKILKQLFSEGASSISTLCDAVGVSTPSMLKLLADLVNIGWIEKSGSGVSIGGRKPDLYALKDERALIICVDIELFDTRIAILDNNCNFISEVRTVSLPISKSRTDFFSILLPLLEEVLQSNGIDKSKVIGCYVGMPGLVNTEKGENYSYLIDNLENSSLVEAFEKALDLPVIVQNDMAGSAIAEFRHGLAKGKKNALVLLMDWGVGLGIIMDGKLRRGATGFSGEFGHIPFVENGALCYCGKHGCLETIASGNALSKTAREGLLLGKKSMLNELSKEELERIEPEAIINAANRGDQYAIQLLSNIGANMGKGISILIQLFNPELIVLTGKIAKAKQYITLPMQQSINTYCMTQIREEMVIESSVLGENSRLLGYATDGIDRFLEAYLSKKKLKK